MTPFYILFYIIYPITSFTNDVLSIFIIHYYLSLYLWYRLQKVRKVIKDIKAYNKLASFCCLQKLHSKILKIRTNMY